MSDIVNIKSNGKMLEFWLDELSNYSELRSSLIEKLSVDVYKRQLWNSA